MTTRQMFIVGQRYTINYDYDGFKKLYTAKIEAEDENQIKIIDKLGDTVILNKSRIIDAKRRNYD
jgi:hypothetical protein